MAEDNQPVKIQKANCDNENVNINGVVQAQTQEQTLGSGGFNPGAGDAALTGQDLTPEEAFAAINDNGDPLITAERNILNVCFNDNDNELNGDFTGTQTQTPQEEECILCFTNEFITGPIEITEDFIMLFERTFDTDIDLVAGEELTLLELCRLFEEFSETLDQRRFVLLLEALNIIIPLNIEPFINCLIDAGIIVGSTG